MFLWSHKLRVPQYMPTHLPASAPDFREGGEFRSCLHNSHPIILKSCLLLNRQIMMTDEGRNMEATLDMTRSWRRFRRPWFIMRPWSNAGDRNQSTDTLGKRAMEHWLLLTSSIPCLGDFSPCTTKTKELQVVGRSYASLFLLHPNYLQPTSNYHSGKMHFHFLSFDCLGG